MAWDIAAAWNTGDINARATNACAVINDAGTPKIIAPVQHGVKCFDRDGNLLWTYNSITNGYDVRHIATGNLNGTGYNDCTVVASGYYNTSTDGKVAILDKDGNALQLILTSGFSGTAPSSTRYVAVDGTDIYVSTNLGFHKFTKSGSTWSESWYKAIGECTEIKIKDAGNGKRVFVAMSGTGAAIYCYQTDGTEDWHYHSNNGYARLIEFGELDSTVAGSQICYPFQSGFAILDKDGNALDTADIVPGNVCIGVTCYDNNGDGEDEIYISDMNDDVECYERTGVNTYTEQYRKTDLFPTGKYGGLTHYDINGDGSDEIIAISSDGHVRIYDKTLATELKDLNVGHGTAGGWIPSYQQLTNGTVFADTSNDGHVDLVVSGATGYVDVFECSGFGTSVTVSPDAQTATSSQPAASVSTQIGKTVSLNVQTVTFAGTMPTITKTPATGNVSINAGVQAVTSSLPNPSVTAVRNATLSAGVQSLSSSQPLATVSAIQNITTAPDALTGTITNPNCSITTSSTATVQPSALSFSASQPEPSVATVQSVVVSPDALVGTFSQPDASVSTSTHATLNLSALEATASLPNPTVTGVRNTSVSLSSLSADFSQANPSVSTTRNATFQANVLEVSASQPAPSVSTTMNVTSAPDVQTLTCSLPNASVSAGGSISVSPSALNATFALPAVTVEGIANTSTTPDAQEAVFSLQAPSVSTAMNVASSPDVQALTASLPAPSVSAVQNTTISAQAQSLTASAPSVSTSTSTGVNLQPSAQTGVFSLPALTVQAVRNISVLADALSVIFSQPEPSVDVSSSIHVDEAVIEAVFSLPSPSITVARAITYNAPVMQIGGYPQYIYLDGKICMRVSGEHYIRL